MKKTKFTENQIVKILKENQLVRSVLELARELGVNKSSIYYWRKIDLHQKR
ncbi:transposase [Algibacter sp.]|uniref:transposase n=1 Tax=Algibacter sp. TaxID=1872428 RepID=UPI003440DC8F